VTDIPAERDDQPEQGGPQAMRGSAPVMEWQRFVGAWAAAHDGFDLRYAGPVTRWWVRCAYRSGMLATRNAMSAGMLIAIALVCAILVPLLASPGGRWPFAAAAVAVIGLVSDGAADAVGVLAERRSRLTGFYRIMVERVTELCWVLACVLLGGDRTIAAVCVVLIVVHEYARLGAVAAGLRAAGGSTVGDRPTRVAIVLIVLIIAAVVSGMTQDLAAGTTTLLLAVWALLALFGLVQLISIVRTALR
jgi:hypothetical protein